METTHFSLSDSGNRKRLLYLQLLCVAQLLLYAGLLRLNEAFSYSSHPPSRPLLTMLAIFAASFVVYFAAIPIALRCLVSQEFLWTLVISSVLFRTMLLPTNPIQEVDIYRYLWDGAATANHVNPYRYSPAIIQAAEQDARLPSDLQRLVHLRQQSAALDVILRRIHFADLPTVYPPVSQVIFAIADYLTPKHLSAERRLIVLKGILVLFDLGTCVLIYSLLLMVGMHPGWTILYAWCPLVLKEFANSGHLDSIAVFWTTLSVWWIVRIMERGSRSYLATTCGAALLALAIGAKLYPIVLLPVMVAGIAARIHWQQALYYCLMTVLFGGFTVAPMLVTQPYEAAEPFDAPSQESRQETGLRAFLTQWEMNDFLFMLVSENLRPRDNNDSRPSVWFAVVPDTWRSALIRPMVRIIGADTKTTSFLVARALTTGVFGVISVALAWGVYRRATLEYFLEATFLTLAWFWLLSPTQNPWYWTWSLPLLPFARNRAWLAVSCLAFVYYFRFWLSNHYPDTFIMGTLYTGPQFYDSVVVWFVSFPWFAWLTFSKFWSNSMKGSAERGVMIL